MALVRNPSRRRASARHARSDPVRSSRGIDRAGSALHGGSRSGRRTHRRDRRSPGRITSAAELSQPSWSPIAQPRKQGHWHALGDLQRRVAIAVGRRVPADNPGCLACPRHDVLRDIGREADEHGPIGRPVLTWGRPPPLRVSASRQQRRTAERRPSCRPSPESDSQHRRRAFLGRPPGCVPAARWAGAVAGVLHGSARPTVVPEPRQLGHFAPRRSGAVLGMSSGEVRNTGGDLQRANSALRWSVGLRLVGEVRKQGVRPS